VSQPVCLETRTQMEQLVAVIGREREKEGEREMGECGALRGRGVGREKGAGKGWTRAGSTYMCKFSAEFVLYIFVYKCAYICICMCNRMVVCLCTYIFILRLLKRACMHLHTRAP
jgi:hypothetical protein